MIFHLKSNIDLGWRQVCRPVDDTKPVIFLKYALFIGLELQKLNILAQMFFKKLSTSLKDIKILNSGTFIVSHIIVIHVHINTRTAYFWQFRGGHDLYSYLIYSIYNDLYIL